MLIFSVQEMQSLAVRLAKILQAGDCLTLEGDLGAGKTTFVQALIHHLSDAMVGVTSPTFTLLQTYDVTLASGQPTTIWHYDLYRLEEMADIQELGLEDALEGDIAVIEWPEIVRPQLPETSIRLTIEFTEAENNREVTFETQGEPAGRLQAAGLC